MRTSSSYIYCSSALGSQLCALGNVSVEYFWIKFESHKVKCFGLKGVPMVTTHVPLFSSSTCITSSREMRVSSILKQNLNAIMSSILVQREYHWLPSLYLCLAQVHAYSSSYIYCSAASGPQLCALGNKSVMNFCNKI
jgi:hypothetical protein